MSESQENNNTQNQQNEQVQQEEEQNLNNNNEQQQQNQEQEQEEEQQYSEYEDCSDEDEEEIIDPEQKQNNEEEQKQNPETDLGCAHYKRNCKVQAPCCKLWYGCRLCHDDVYTGTKDNCLVERMDRYGINLIECLVCNTQQPPSNECISCTVQFSRYYCDTCHLWQDKIGVNITHCEKCHMCRMGKKEDLFHCDVCNVCQPKILQNNHICVKNSENHNCPVCMENLKYTTKPFQLLPKCGHGIHVKCLKEYQKHGNGNAYKCPLCNQSQFSMPKQEILHLDQVIRQTSENLDNFPKEFKEEDGSLKKVDIICNECSKKSTGVNFHPMGLKCKNEECGSYLTDML